MYHSGLPDAVTVRIRYHFHVTAIRYMVCASTPVWYFNHIPEGIDQPALVDITCKGNMLTLGDMSINHWGFPGVALMDFPENRHGVLSLAYKTCAIFGGHFSGKSPYLIAEEL